MRSIAAVTNTAHFTDTEAQTTQATSSEKQGKGGRYLKCAVFAACALGIAGGLAQAFRSHNPQPYYPANRQLQSNNQMANTTAEPGTDIATQFPTLEPTQAPCPEGQYRKDPKRKNEQMGNLKTALGVTAGASLASIAVLYVADRAMANQHGLFQKLVGGVGLLLVMSGPTAFMFVSFITVFAALDEADGLCHERGNGGTDG